MYNKMSVEPALTDIIAGAAAGTGKAEPRLEKL